jgi:hypothetical protein
MNMKQAQTKSAADEYEAGSTTLEDTINRACFRLEHSRQLMDTINRACFFTGARVAVAKARRLHCEDEELTQWADCAMRLL